jgi:hypothetical protein
MYLAGRRRCKRPAGCAAQAFIFIVNFIAVVLYVNGSVARGPKRSKVATSLRAPQMSATKLQNINRPCWKEQVPGEAGYMLGQRPLCLVSQTHVLCHQAMLRNTESRLCSTSRGTESHKTEVNTKLQQRKAQYAPESHKTEEVKMGTQAAILATYIRKAMSISATYQHVSSHGTARK